MTDASTTKCCGNCRFYLINPQAVQQGECHKECPKIIVMPGVNGFPTPTGQWPATKNTNWCGEFKPRLDA